MLDRISARHRAFVLAAVCLMAALPSGVTQTANLQHHAWSTEAGLPQNSVHQVLQTRNGYLWLATESGVVRFDGVSFTVFNAENEPAFTSNDITSLAEDESGTLWIGTADGLLSVPRGTFRHWGERDGLPSASVLAIAPVGGDSILVLTTSGLARFHDGKAEPVFGAPQEITGLQRQQDGSVLLFTSGQPLRYNQGKIEADPKTSDNSLAGLRGILPEPSGGTLAWTGHEVIRAGTAGQQHWTTGRELPGTRVETVMKDQAGTLWIGTNRGLVSSSAASRKISPVPALGSNDILSLLEDAEGNVWIGTATSGLHALRPRKFHDLPAVGDEEVSCLTQAPDGTTWLGTRDDGLRRIRFNSAGAIADKPVSDNVLTSPVILSLASGPAGDLWVGTPDGLTHLQPTGTATRYTSSDGLPDDLIRSLLVQADGTAWVGTRRGLVRMRGARRDLFTTANGLGGNLIGALFQSHVAGALWIGNLSGVSVLRNDRFRTYGHAQGLASNLVTGLAEDRQGRLWAATRDAGLFLFRDDRFVAIDLKVVPRELLSITADQQGFLWLRTHHGIVRVSAGEVAACPASSCAAGVAVYGVEDGIPDEAMVDGTNPSTLATASGELWFATRKGIAIADPRTLTVNPVPPPVVLERFLADSSVIPVDAGTVTIPAGHSRYNFEFAGLSFTAPAKVLYRFRLSGYESTWSTPSTRRYASYTNLAPGRYTFQVQAANNDGLWNETGASISFRILPPLYRRWWFILLCLLVLLSCAAGLYRLRLLRLQRGFDAVLGERNRIAREIHDTLAQDLVGVSLQLDLVSQFIARNSFAEASHQLKATRDLVKSGLEEARQSIWNLRANTRQVSLPARITEMTRRFAGDTVAVKLKIGGVYRDLEPDLEAQVLRIAQEAVSNVVRHAAATSMKLDLLYAEEELVLTVEDNGRGFSPDTAFLRQGHYGLRGMRERAEAIHAELQVTGAEGSGTTVRLIVPLLSKKGKKEYV